MFTVALFTVVKTWKQLECPSADEWMKMWHIYTMEYYSAIKGTKLVICSDLDEPRVCHTG